MRNKKGFTLVELLVAATIIGVLAVFATVQLRKSAAETRWTQAKAKADALAFAAYRAKVDHPSLSFTNVPVQKSANLNDCTYGRGTGQVDPNTLISCGYLENSGWTDDYFAYYVCNDNCDGYIAWVEVQSSARLPGEYKSYKYYAHPSREGKEQKTGE